MTRPASIARAAVFCPGTVVVYVGVRAQGVRDEEQLPADHACTEAAHLRAGRHVGRTDSEPRKIGVRREAQGGSVL